MEEVILVNEQDAGVGSMEKMEAHRKGILHRAFSIFIFNERGEMLLQQRASSKYHSGGLWTNACCGHPRPGESTEAGAVRRLNEELNFAVPLTKIFDFTYSASFSNGLTENEFDHVFVGRFSDQIQPNPTEVQDYCFRKMDDLAANMLSHPHKYTAWFCIAFPLLERWLQQNKI